MRHAHSAFGEDSLAPRWIYRACFVLRFAGPVGAFPRHAMCTAANVKAEGLMRKFMALGVVLCHVVMASAGEVAEGDSDVIAFSRYVSDVSRLNGMYHGVADYCRQFVPTLILNQSDAAWREHNGSYIDSVDMGIEKFIAARVEAERKAEAIAQMKAYARTWFQAAHDKSNVLDQVQRADNKALACSYMLGTMASESFYLQKMFPADADYWSHNLKP